MAEQRNFAHKTHLKNKKTKNTKENCLSVFISHDSSPIRSPIFVASEKKDIKNLPLCVSMMI